MIFKKRFQIFRDKLGPLGEFGKYLVIGIISAALTILLFAKLAEDLIYDELNVFDSTVTNLIDRFASPALTRIMKVITDIGSAPVLIIVALLAFYILYRKHRHYWDSAMVALSLGGGFLLNEILKFAFHRARPNIARLVEAGGYSFPSGHAMISATFYGFIAYLFWINMKRFKLRYVIVVSTLILIVLIGISRIYLGVHYPSDVVAAYAAGGFWLTGCILGLQTIRYYKASE